jgi:hypothetical protein
VSVFVAAGDIGAANCDNATTEPADHGVAVNVFASTAYNVAVGGADFGDTYAGTNANYRSPNNGPTYGSALSYVPEIPWSQNCASTLAASYLGFSTTYGANGLCASAIGEPFIGDGGGGGGPSNCAHFPTVSQEREPPSSTGPISRVKKSTCSRFFQGQAGCSCV